MSYFSRYDTHKHSHGKLVFQPVAILDDGLGDEIEAERQEQGIVLEDRPDSGSLEDFWAKAVDEARKDPSWNFTSDEDNAALY